MPYVSQGRPPFSFVLIDLPSDHEIDNRIVTECQVINSILHNRALGTRVRTIIASSSENFNKAGWRPYRDSGFVHLSTHGHKNGISLIGGKIGWNIVADKLKIVAPVLSKSKKRVLCLSCCYSDYGFKALRPLVEGHFTGMYTFRDDVVEFSTAMTVWSMFYYRKKVSRPAQAVVDDVNKFFGDGVIVYRSV